MKIGDPILPHSPESEYDKQLNRTLLDLFRKLFAKVNGLAAGSYGAIDGVAAAIPTVGTFVQGDILRNSNPTELGIATAKYVILQWVCVVGGTPGTWRECRTLTGN